MTRIAHSYRKKKSLEKNRRSNTNSNITKSQNTNARTQVLKMWINVTQQWCSLHSIFKGSADIQSQLPDTTAEFMKVDQRFRKMMELAQRFRKVKECCESKYFHDTLKNYLIPKLESCQKDCSVT